MEFLELKEALEKLLKDVKPGGMSKKVKASSFSEAFKETYKHISGSDYSNEKIFLCLNGLKDKPLSSCGNHSRFIDVKTGYHEYCSLPKQGPGFCSHCRSIIDSRKDYSKNGFKSDKYKQSMLDKYGVSNISQTDKQKEYLRSICKFTDEEFKAESEKKIIERFGSMEALRQYSSMKTTERFNNLTEEERAEHARKTSEGKKLKHISKIINLPTFENCEILFDLEDYKGGYITNKYPFRCKKCKFEFYSPIMSNKTIICPQCTTKDYTGKSKQEDEFCNWIIENLNPNEHVLRGNRTTISPYELDLYIPNLNLAFEYSGVYWHQEQFVGSMKHQTKVKLCKEKGIQLVTVFSDDWLYKKEAVKNWINYFINRSQPLNITAVIGEVETNVAQEFIKDNVAYESQGSNYIGSYIDGKLTAMAVYNKYENCPETWNLITIIGEIKHLPNLMKYFIQKYNPNKVHAIVDLEYCCDQLYTNSGFIFKELTDPDYSLVHVNKELRVHKNDILELTQYYKVYGCGNAIYEWRKDE